MDLHKVHRHDVDLHKVHRHDVDLVEVCRHDVDLVDVLRGTRDVDPGFTRLQRSQGPQSLSTQSSGQGSRLSRAPRGISSGSHR